MGGLASQRQLIPGSVGILVCRKLALQRFNLLSEALELDQEVILELLALFSHCGQLVCKFASIALTELIFQQVQFSYGPFKFKTEILFLTCNLFSFINQLLEGGLVLLIVLEGNFASLY